GWRGGGGPVEGGAPRRRPPWRRAHRRPLRCNRLCRPRRLLRSAHGAEPHVLKSYRGGGAVTRASASAPFIDMSADQAERLTSAAIAASRSLWDFRRDTSTAPNALQWSGT